jgi:hypothetical protein
MDILVLAETGAYDSSQASDVGSIPIARSINDSIGLAHLNYLNLAKKWPFLDPKWTIDGPLVFRRKNGPVGRTYKPDWPVSRAFVSASAPKAGALPGCATPRLLLRIDSTALLNFPSIDPAPTVHELAN